MIQKNDVLNKEKYFERFIVLFDAVVAIVITIIVLTIKIPDGITSITSDVAIQIGLSILFYGVSFYIVASYWTLHHRIIEGIKGASQKFVIYNFTFLFVLSLFPVAVSFLNESAVRHVSGLVPFAFTLYMIVNFLASVSQVRIIGYMVRHSEQITYDESVAEHIGMDGLKHYHLQAKLKMYFNIAPIVVAFFFPQYAFVAYVISMIASSRVLKIMDKKLEEKK